MTVWNPFRILGDLSHILSKVVLIWSIHWNRSSEGVSLITQVLYMLVFVTRYLDIFAYSIFENFINFYLFSVKGFYIASSAYIVFLMTVAYARTREKEQAWKFGIYCLVGALIMAAPFCKIFEEGPIVGHETINGEEYVRRMYSHKITFKELCWAFSEILEAVAVLPQLILLRQTNVPTVFDSYYLVLLGSYRALYILNWIVRIADKDERHFDPIAVIFGTIQTILYIDFAWVYYSRQRVKLRAGGIVDSDDLERGFFIGKLIRKNASEDDEDYDEADSRKPAGRWGARGVSVSADEEFDATGEDARPLADPSAFEDSDDEPEASTSKKPKAVDDTEEAEEASAWAEERTTAGK